MNIDIHDVYCLKQSSHYLKDCDTVVTTIEIKTIDSELHTITLFHASKKESNNLGLKEDRECTFPDCGCPEARLCMAGEPNDCCLDFNR